MLLSLFSLDIKQKSLQRVTFVGDYYEKVRRSLFNDYSIPVYP